MNWLDNFLEKISEILKTKLCKCEKNKKKCEKSLTKFGWNSECWAVQKRVNIIDLVQSFSVSPHVPFLNLLFEQIAIPTSIYLQNLASIQPRTSPKNFESSSCWEFELKLWILNLLFAAQAYSKDGTSHEFVNTTAGRPTLGTSIGLSGTLATACSSMPSYFGTKFIANTHQFMKIANFVESSTPDSSSSASTKYSSASRRRITQEGGHTRHKGSPSPREERWWCWTVLVGHARAGILWMTKGDTVNDERRHSTLENSKASANWICQIRYT